MGAHNSLSQIIYLIRHGETTWNREGRVQGHLDSPLTERGIAQAKAAGRTLRPLLNGENFLLLTSPLGRARQTAALVLRQLGEPAPAWRRSAGSSGST